MLQVKPTNTIEVLRNLRTRGAYFEAAEMAERELAIRKNDIALSKEERDILEYLCVACFLDCECFAKAQELYEAFRLGNRPDLKSQSLGPRLAKGRAFKSTGPDRPLMMLAAAQAYETAYARRNRVWDGQNDGDVHSDPVWFSYLLVNAATMHLLAGNPETAKSWAAAAFKVADEAKTGKNRDKDKFYRRIVGIEAALILGDMASVERLAGKLGSMKTHHYSDRARRYAQLAMVCDALGVDGGVRSKLLDAVRVPTVIYYAGHIISPDGRFPASQEADVKRRIRAYLKKNEVSVAFGSLAAGADILFAEACLENDIDLHIVLPFDESDFLDQSVRPAGGDWERRFHQCLSQCKDRSAHGTTSVSQAIEGQFLNDETLFSYGARLALGLAMLRARHLHSDVRMVAVYDGKKGSEYGTYGSIKLCRKLKLDYDVIAVKGSKPQTVFNRHEPVELSTPRRLPLAILFGDIEGFSNLKEEDVPKFHQFCMAQISRILDKYADAVRDRNSWGDAIYVVFDDPVLAIKCGLEIQNYMKNTDFRSLGLSSQLALRIGAHFGPVFDGADFVRKQNTFYGVAVTKAARIEPKTPVGEIYVTEPMAAALTLEKDTRIECDYVGLVPLAKDFGELRLYLVRNMGAV